MKDVYSKIPVPDTAYDIAHGLDPHTIFSNFKNIFNNNDTMVRIDQQFGQKVNVFYRYLHDTFPEVLPQGQFTTVPIPGANTTTVINPGTQHLAKGTVTINPTMVVNGRLCILQRQYRVYRRRASLHLRSRRISNRAWCFRTLWA